MSRLRPTVSEEMQVRFENATTAEDWKGNYMWACYVLYDTLMHSKAFEEYYDIYDIPISEYVRKVEEAKRKFPAPEMLEEFIEDPVFDKVLEKEYLKDFDD